MAVCSHIPRSWLARWAFPPSSRCRASRCGFAMAIGSKWTAAEALSRASLAVNRKRCMGSEVAARADFTGIRYAQCWEDADILLAGLDVQPGDVCLSIASAGDISLA